MDNQTSNNMEGSSNKQPDYMKTLIAVLIGFNAFLMLAVLGLLAFIIINRNTTINVTTEASVHEETSEKRASVSSYTSSVEESDVVREVVDTGYEKSTKEEDEKNLKLACEHLGYGNFQKAVYLLNKIGDESILGNYLTHAKACANVRAQLLLMDIEAADADYKNVSEDLPGADIIRLEYDSVKNAKAAIEIDDYDTAVSIYENLGGSYNDLIPDIYKYEADYYISHYQYDKAGPALLKLINDSKYLSMHYYETVVEEDENGDTGYPIGRELFKKSRQYWDGQYCVFALCYHDLDKEPGGFYYRFTSGNKYVFCEYDMTGAFKGRAGDY